MFQKFDVNTNGKDFVCGDIHGMYQDLMDALEQINFNKKTDRLFVVGDLIDRGPDSGKVLDLLNEDWFFSILGNHEVMMLGSMQIPYDKATPQQAWNIEWNQRVWYGNGGAWWSDVDDVDARRYLDIVATLPVAAEVHLPSKRVIGLIHAEAQDTRWDDVIAEAEDASEMVIDWPTEGSTLYSMIWSRQRVYTPVDMGTDVDGIDHIFHGHTILEDIHVVGNCSYIDTGCFLNAWEGHSGRLTILNIEDYLDSLSDQDA